MPSNEKIINSLFLQDELNENVWYLPNEKNMGDPEGQNYKIKPEIRSRLLKAAEIFIDYLDVDGSKSLRVVNGLEKILSDKNFMARNVDNPTWKSISTYMQIRDIFAAKLAQRQSGSLDAISNTDLRLAFETIVQKLKQEDLGFSDVYDRFLSQDKLYYKALTKVAR